MSKYTYIGGALVPHAYAHVPLEDRGYQFGDGVYEVAAYFNHTLVDGEEHWDRLERSLSELGMKLPITRSVLNMRIERLMRANRRRDGIVYLQCTRGVQKPRNHVFPADLKAHLTLQILPARPPAKVLKESGVAAITTPDNRWGRCDIKTINLLPNILARVEATKANAREAWQVNAEGFVTEGTLSNAYIVNKDGVLVTHPATHTILGGITRDMVLKMARDLSIRVEERAFTPAEAYDAKEAFMTSATSNVLPITALDGKPIGNGSVGETTAKLLAAYEAHIFKQTGKQL